MSTLTKAKLNKSASQSGLKLVKGEGYFYWLPTELDLPSIYVCHFNHMDDNSWWDELNTATRLKADADEAEQAKKYNFDHGFDAISNTDQALQEAMNAAAMAQQKAGQRLRMLEGVLDSIAQMTDTPDLHDRIQTVLKFTVGTKKAED